MAEQKKAFRVHKADVDGRAFVFDMAGHEPRAAWLKASVIRHPWYRCQALAAVAAALKDRGQSEQALKEAFCAAAENPEPNRAVTVAAWPLEVLAQKRFFAWLDKEVNRLLAVIRREPHPTRRGDALHMIMHRLLAAEMSASQHVFQRILSEFVAACRAGHGWKRDRNLKDLAKAIAATDHTGAMKLMGLIESPRVQRQARRMLRVEERS